MIFGNVKPLLLMPEVFYKFLKPVMTELNYGIRDYRLNENLSLRNSGQISAFEDKISTKSLVRH